MAIIRRTLFILCRCCPKTSPRIFRRRGGGKAEDPTSWSERGRCISPTTTGRPAGPANAARGNQQISHTRTHTHKPHKNLCPQLPSRSRKRVRARGPHARADRIDCTIRRTTSSNRQDPHIVMKCLEHRAETRNSCGGTTRRTQTRARRDKTSRSRPLTTSLAQWAPDNRGVPMSFL